MRAWMIASTLLLAGVLLASCGPSTEETKPGETPAPATGSGQQSDEEAGGTQPAGTTDDTAALVQEKCTGCHTLDRVKAANKDTAAWQSTVTRMITNGAQLTDAEVAEIVTFLADGGAADLQ